MMSDNGLIDEGPTITEAFAPSIKRQIKIPLQQTVKINPFTAVYPVIKTAVVKPGPIPTEPNPFTAVKPFLVVKPVPEPKPFVSKSIFPGVVTGVVNPFLAEEGTRSPPKKPPPFQSTELSRRVNVFFDRSSLIKNPFSAGALPSSSAGHFGEGNDFDEVDEARGAAPSFAAPAATGTFANGFGDMSEDDSSNGITGTFAGGFEDCTADENVKNMYGFSLSNEAIHFGGNYYGFNDEEETTKEAAAGFVEQPLLSGMANKFSNAWRFSGPTGVGDDFADIDEIEEVTVTTSDDDEDSYNEGCTNTVSMSTAAFTFNGAMTSGVKRSIGDISSPGKKSKKRKKKSRKRARTSTEQRDNSFCPEEIWSRPEMKKYWYNRYELFSKYDEGIKLDLESWFSVTPEKIAKEISDKISSACPPNGIIIDAFCGCGGNTIQFAKSGRKVISIDIDPIKIENAKHNAKIYGVEQNITFMVADFMAVAPVLKADVVFLSPPWGGPEYNECATFDLETMIPMDGFKVFELARNIAPNIAYYVPRHTDTDQLVMLAGLGNSVEIQRNYYEGRVKAITAYYGDLIDPAILQ